MIEQKSADSKLYTDSPRRSRYAGPLLTLLAATVVAVPAVAGVDATGPELQSPTEANWRLLFDYDVLSDWSIETRDAEALRGFWLVVATAIFTVIITPALGRGTKNVPVYRPYEQRLLKLNRLALRDILQYHAQYKWGSYSGVAVGMVLVSVPLMIVNRSSITSVEFTIQAVIVALMAIAIILLTLADLVHTNTQTPIIPISRRFELIDFSVQAGMLGTLTLIMCVLFFASLVSLIVTSITCTVFVVAVLYSNRLRRIPKEDFFRYFGITGRPAFWTEAGAREGCPEEDVLFAADEAYIEMAAEQSRESFYQRRKEHWPMATLLDEWVHAMRVEGVISPTTSSRPVVEPAGHGRSASVKRALDNLERRTAHLRLDEQRRALRSAESWLASLTDEEIRQG